MMILGVDVETTGLDVNNDRITELGYVLWDTDANAEKYIGNEYLYAMDYPKLTPFITELTGITDKDLQCWGLEPKNAFNMFNAKAAFAKCIVAHNGTNFDRPIMEAEFKRAGVKFPDLHWIDTATDVPYPEIIKTRKLVHLAAEHGFLNPSAHRAYADVVTMLKILGFYDIKNIIKLSKEPKVILEALTLAPWKDDAEDGKKQVDFAKARGYRWKGSDKKWIKTIRESQLKQELAHDEFKIVVISEEPDDSTKKN